MLSDRLHWRDIRNISTFRLTLWFGLLFLLGVTALLGISYALIARELTSRSDGIIRDEAAKLIGLPPQSLPRAIDQAMKHATSRLNYFSLLDADGHRIAGNFTVYKSVPLDRIEDYAPAPGDAESLRILATRGPNGTTLFIARDIMQLIDVRHQMLLILIGSGALIALVVAGAGFALSIAPLKRVRALELAGREIAAGNLDARMPLLGRGDELDLFAGTVNVMVDEVVRMIAQVKDVTDVIAHDLRSPLVRVHGQLGQMRRGAEPGSALDDRLGVALNEVNILLDRFAALLRVAELQASQRRAGFTDMDVSPLVETAADLYQPAAEDRGIALDVAVEPDLTLFGDDKLLFEAVSNLIDNAIKFTPEGGHVLVVARREGSGIVIEVRDDGPGILPEERDLVLRRFHRGRHATGIAGSGIGLSAVMAIVQIHGFRLELADAAPGLAARIHCTA